MGMLEDSHLLSPSAFMHVTPEVGLSSFKHHSLPVRMNSIQNSFFHPFPVDRDSAFSSDSLSHGSSSQSMIGSHSSSMSQSSMNDDGKALDDSGGCQIKMAATKVAMAKLGLKERKHSYLDCVEEVPQTQSSPMRSSTSAALRNRSKRAFSSHV